MPRIAQPIRMRAGKGHEHGLFDVVIQASLLPMHSNVAWLRRQKFAHRASEEPNLLLVSEARNDPKASLPVPDDDRRPPTYFTTPPVSIYRRHTISTSSRRISTIIQLTPARTASTVRQLP